MPALGTPVSGHLAIMNPALMYFPASSLELWMMGNRLRSTSSPMSFFSFTGASPSATHTGSSRCASFLRSTS